MRRILCCLFLAILTPACMHVEVNADSNKPETRRHDAQRQVPFFVWGFGAYHLNVKEHCKGKKLEQFKLEERFVDGLLQMATLGIYSPMTGKFWCKKGKG